MWNVKQRKFIKLSGSVKGNQAFGGQKKILR